MEYTLDISVLLMSFYWRRMGVRCKHNPIKSTVIMFRNAL